MRKEKGITLIALIVTIIILLILAGVAIVTLTGENGLLKRANNAVEKTKEAEAVEVIELQLISCRVEYTLNRNVDIPSYVEKENNKITVEVDSSSNPDNNPVGHWTMSYGGYVFEIYDLQILYYYKEGNKIKPSIKDINVTGEYQFASISDSKIDVEFKVELPEELAGATVSINVTTEATGTVEGSYNNATGIYTGTIKTDGTSKTNGTYTYEVKATKDGEEYTTKTVVKTDKFLDNPEIEVPEESKKWNELTINVKNNYPKEAGVFYKYYISDSETYGTEEFTQETSVTKTELKAKTEYNIKVEAYLSNQTTMVETTIQETTLEKITEIRYIEDLEAIAEDLTASYKLMNDLDFKERSSYKTQEKYEYYNLDADGDGKPDNSWIPIGGIRNYANFKGFEGKFNGNYHAINNLYIYGTASSEEFIGLFGKVSAASMENVYLKDAEVFSSYGKLGTLVGYALDGSNFRRISVQVKIEGENYSSTIGGIVGHAADNSAGVIEECYSNCEINCRDALGGIVGMGSTVKDCYSTGTIKASTYYSGGITGYRGVGLNCYSLAKTFSRYNVNGPLTSACNYGNWYTKFTDSYWCAKASGVTSALSGTEVQYEDLFKKSTYQNWDFENIWQIEEGRTTPYLRWMKNPPQEVTKEYIDGTISE